MLRGLVWLDGHFMSVFAEALHADDSKLVLYSIEGRSR